MPDAPAQVAADCGVEEVLHFTTEKGVLGALQVGKLLSRKRVEGNPDLAFIFTGSGRGVIPSGLTMCLCR